MKFSITASIVSRWKMASKSFAVFTSQLELDISLIPFTLLSYEDVDWPSAVPSSSRRRVTSTGYTLVELPVSLSTPSDEHRTNTNENVPIVPLVSEIRSETPLSHREMDTLRKPENPEKITEQSCALEVSASCETSTQSVDRSNVLIFSHFKIINLTNILFVAAQILEEEIRRLKEARLCKVCLDEEVSIAYIPCGHIVTCVQCAAGKLQYFDQIMLLKF